VKDSKDDLLDDRGINYMKILFNSIPKDASMRSL